MSAYLLEWHYWYICAFVALYFVGVGVAEALTGHEASEGPEPFFWPLSMWFLGGRGIVRAMKQRKAARMAARLGKTSL